MSSVCVRRVQRELHDIQANGISPTVHLVPRGDNLTILDALIMGLPNTPYDGAVMHLELTIPPEYPMRPPSVKYLSTEAGSLRIHPQLYADGKVCLSILGTWHGPRWTASWSLRALLLSIQALLNEEPLRCEPGLENAPQDEVDRANVFVVHEVVRALLLAHLAPSSACVALRFIGAAPSWASFDCAEIFTDMAQAYVHSRSAAIERKMQDLSQLHDGHRIQNPFIFSSFAGSVAAMLRSDVKRYNFSSLTHRLAELLPCDKDAAAAAVASSSKKSESGSDGCEDDRDAESRCRICHQTADESSVALIAPCRCAGSIRLAHSDCLLAWMARSPRSVASWRCDICLEKLNVELGPGAPLGWQYLLRELDMYSEDFDAPGLVSVLLISVAQTPMACMQAGIARAALTSSTVALSAAGAWLSAPLLLIALVAEVGRLASYQCFCAIKFHASYVGAQWRPADLGQAGENLVLPLLSFFTEFLNMGLAPLLGARAVLCVLIWLVTYLALSFVTSYLYGQSFFVALIQFALGQLSTREFAVPWPLTAHERFPVLETLLSERWVGVLCAYDLFVGIISLSASLRAIGQLLKKAFFDHQPEPIRLLPFCAEPQTGRLGETSDGSGGRQWGTQHETTGQSIVQRRGARQQNA